VSEIDSGSPCCKYCGEWIPEGKDVRLWDGGDYCEDCVESTLPGLANYAREHASLEERAPFSRRLYAFRLAPAAIALFLSAMAGCPENFPGGLLSYVFFCSILLGIIFVPFYFLSLRSVEGVSVQDGWLTAGEGPYWQLGMGRQGEYVARRRQVLLSKGTAWEIRERWITTLPGLLGARPMQDVIVAIWSVPSRWGPLQLSSATIICRCGWSAATRRRWEAFFQLMGMPRLDMAEVHRSFRRTKHTRT